MKTLDQLWYWAFEALFVGVLAVCFTTTSLYVSLECIRWPAIPWLMLTVATQWSGMWYSERLTARLKPTSASEHFGTEQPANP